MYVMQVEIYKFHTIAWLQIPVNDVPAMDVLHPWRLKMHSQHFILLSVVQLPVVQMLQTLELKYCAESMAL